MDVEKLRELRANATPGEWRIEARPGSSDIVSDCGGGDIVACAPDADESFARWEGGTMQFIIAAHKTLPDLLALLQSQQAVIEGMRAEIEAQSKTIRYQSDVADKLLREWKAARAAMGDGHGG